MYKQTKKYLDILESTLEEEMRHPVEIQLYNWLEKFLYDIYREGYKDALLERSERHGSE
jgi:hypothetical protein